MFCCHCGKQIPDDAKFCGFCGGSVAEEPMIETPVTPAPVQENVEYTEPVTYEAPTYQEPAYEAPVYEAPVTYADPVCEAPVKKKKKGLVIALCIIIPVLLLLGVGGWFGYNMWLDKNTYEEATALVEEGKYEEAIELFVSLGDYEDAEDLAEEWQAKLDAYAEAQELLADEKFDAAQEAFADLKDFRDSAEHVKNIIPYAKATYIFEAAAESNSEALDLVLEPGSAFSNDPIDISMLLYSRAAEMFEELGDYENAAGMKMECYLQSGLLMVEQEDWYSVEDYLLLLDEDAYAILDEAYTQACAEGTFFESLQAALAERIAAKDSGAYSDSEIIEIDYEYLSKYNDMHFRSEELEELFWLYMDGVDIQYAYLDNYGNNNDSVMWYTGEAYRWDAVEKMMDQYGFLEDDTDLQESYSGKSARNWAYASIEDQIYKQIIEVVPEFDEEKQLYYFNFNNVTGYDFTLELDLEFYDGANCILEVELPTLEVAEDSENIIYLEIPADDVQWDTWYIYWTYYDIVLDGNAI